MCGKEILIYDYHVYLVIQNKRSDNHVKTQLLWKCQKRKASE